MYLISQVWLNQKFTIVISESPTTHQRQLNKLQELGGSVISSDCSADTLGSVIVNGKRSVWPLTKAEAIEQRSESNG
ncbi:hypothetical protein MOC71_03385 [Bacillus vallismortis]|uniref:Uncharacterized protein n=1 Tax=Bacillus vallismortis TaxID=72361 RepID=A0AAP3CGB9_BACVA|nr:hypothetical protein [Bacillus vallismortis]MCY8315809.1 hypothetical protein [Bacillus vallismortis]